MASFPTISGDVIVSQYDYTESDQWVNSESSLDCGISTTFSENPTVLKKFVLRFPLIQYADVQTLENFWIAVDGMLGEFSFTDDDGTVWTHTRFDQDKLQIDYVDTNHFAIAELKLSAEPN